MTVEEYIHNADGTLVSKDPWTPFLTVGTRVRMINEKVAREIHCNIPNGEIGTINEDCVIDNTYNKNEHSTYVYVRWGDRGLLSCDMQCLEVVK